MGSRTSSFRIDDDLAARFSDAARRIGKGRNWILNRALTEYLDRLREESLAEEARRQSILASAGKRAGRGAAKPEEDFWLRRSDGRGWL